MKLRTCVRVLIAVLLAISGLVETLSATGLVLELSPGGRWGASVYVAAVSGPLQMVGAVLVACGHRTRWALSVLGCYVFLSGVFGNLPPLFNPLAGWGALTPFLSNLALLGGILFWFASGPTLGTRSADLALQAAKPALVAPFRLPVCQDTRVPRIPTPSGTP